MKYSVLNEWNYKGEKPQERCQIERATKDMVEYDGFNLCGKEDGVAFDIYDDLEAAIVNAQFNPAKIEYIDFTEEENKEVNNILKKYEWSDYFGLVKRGEK